MFLTRFFSFLGEMRRGEPLTPLTKPFISAGPKSRKRIALASVSVY
jgi:hypothetical protein